MANDDTILRFEQVSFEHTVKKPILDGVDFSIRRGSKTALMGQNGAGKSTIFGLIMYLNMPDTGSVHMIPGLTVATARQVIPREELGLTVREFFEQPFAEKVYDLDRRIEDILRVVHLDAPLTKPIGTFSGGQQARLLLAYALIQNPDLLLLDEPTNNLDAEGIAHLTKFLVDYPKTCMVISHDAEFLNAFTQCVLYLDVHTRKIEQYLGNYFDAVEQISARIEKENRKNALLAKEIQANKEKANFFANKGGNLRFVAKKMREKAEAYEEEKVEVRREDRTIRPFTIPLQDDLSGELLTINSFLTIRHHQAVEHPANIKLYKNQHLLLSGPNGIGKSTLLETIANKTAKGAIVAPGVKIGYYRQDFSNMDFDKTVYDELSAAMDRPSEDEIRSTAARLLITGELINTQIGHLSEGQKGLVAFARLILMRPGLLILDEPTNHINFRHIPAVAQALSQYEGAMILVSHVPEFVNQIRIDEVLDLNRQ